MSAHIFDHVKHPLSIRKAGSVDAARPCVEAVGLLQVAKKLKQFIRIDVKIHSKRLNRRGRIPECQTAAASGGDDFSVGWPYSVFKPNVRTACLHADMDMVYFIHAVYQAFIDDETERERLQVKRGCHHRG